MNGTEIILEYLEKNKGGAIPSPRSLFGDTDAGNFEIKDINHEKEYITIKPEGSIEIPFEISLLAKATDIVLSEGVVSLESEEDPDGPVVLEKTLKDWQQTENNQTLNTKYVPYLADLIVLSGVASYGWVKTPEGKKIRAIAVREKQKITQKKSAEEKSRDWDRLARNGADKPKVKNGGAYTKEKADVLVTYATRHGSTADIAWSIGNSFSDAGFKAEVKKIQNVDDVRPYKLVIIGTPIYDNNILPEVLNFADLHRDWLDKRKVALFVVGRTLRNKDDEKILQTEKILQKIKNTIPIFDTGMFAGKVAPENLPMKERLGDLFGEKQAGDFRDWREIGEWSKELRKKIFFSDRERS